MLNRISAPQFGAVLKEDPKTPGTVDFYWDGTKYWATGEDADTFMVAARESFEASTGGVAGTRGKPPEVMWGLFEMARLLGRRLGDLLHETTDEMVLAPHEKFRLTKKKLAFFAEERPFDEELRKAFPNG